MIHIEEFPNEILSQVVFYSGLETLNKLGQLNRRFRALVHDLIPHLLKDSALEFEMEQESHWFMRCSLKFVGYDKVYHQASFQAINGTGIQPYTFFYALLIHRPFTFKMKLTTQYQDLQLHLNLPLQLETKSEGIKVSSPINSNCSFLYTVEKRNEEHNHNAHHNKGLRWITPLAFQCSLPFFELASFKYPSLLKQFGLWFKNQAFNLCKSPKSPTLLYPKHLPKRSFTDLFKVEAEL